MMVKKEKKKKEKKEKDPAATKQEVDAVKGFIFVMILLIVALGVFIVITNQKLGRYENYLEIIEREVRGLGMRSLQVKQYLTLINDKDEKVLINYPRRFFQNRYRASGVGVRDDQVTINPRKDVPVKREKYTEVSWTLDIKGINRQQAGEFLYSVEEKSAKARTIALDMRRDAKKGEDIWNGGFKIGYRVAGIKRD